MGWFHALFSVSPKMAFFFEMTPAVLEDENEKVQLSVLTPLRRGRRRFTSRSCPTRG